MSIWLWLRVALVTFIAALLQVVIVSSLAVGAGAADLLLVTVVALGLLRGAIVGAFAGFGGGLVVDLLLLDTLGVTSLVLTLAGFWAGRYAETTARGRRLAPLLAVGAITVLAMAFGMLLRFLLGEEVAVQHVLAGVLVPTFVLNLLLAVPVYEAVRKLTHSTPVIEGPSEVELVA